MFSFAVIRVSETGYLQKAEVGLMALEAVMPRSMVASAYEHLVRVSQCETEQVFML